jgi:CBS domain-containing protein
MAPPLKVLDLAREMIVRHGDNAAPVSRYLAFANRRVGHGEEAALWSRVAIAVDALTRPVDDAADAAGAARRAVARLIEISAARGGRVQHSDPSVEEPAMNVADVMTKRVIALPPEATVEEAARLMIKHKISGLPVIDGESRLIGIVTEGDFLRRDELGTGRRRPRWLEFLLGPGQLAGEYVHAHGRKVGEVMTTDVATVDEAAPLEAAVRIMEERRVKRLPVLRGGRVVGMLARADLVAALVRLVGTAAPAASDLQIRERLLAALERQPWFPRASVEIGVERGVVHLWGAICDERQREALRVAAEAVAGVKRVEDHLVWVEPVSGTVIDRA